MEVYPVETDRPRKEKTQMENWEISKEKLQRYATPEPPVAQTAVCCSPAKTKKAFACEQVIARDIEQFHHRFYTNETKVAQDNFILKYVKGKPTACKHLVNKNCELNPYL